MHTHTYTPHTCKHTPHTHTAHATYTTHTHTAHATHTPHTHAHTTHFRLMSRVHEDHRETADSSDDELQFMSKPQASVGSEGCSKSWYHRLLRQHNRKQRNVNAELDVTKGITLDDIVRRDQAMKDGWDRDDEVMLPSRQRRRVITHSHRPPPADNGAEEPADSSLDESELVPTGQKVRMFPSSLSVREYRKFVGVKADTPVE